MMDSNARFTTALLSVPGPLSVVALVVVLGVLGLQRPQPSQAPNVVPPREQVPVPSGHDVQGNDLSAPSPAMQVLREFLRADELSSERPNRCDAPADLFAPHSPCDALREEFSRLLAKHRLRMKCMIATISDPVSSHFQLNFDRNLSAMTRAFETERFVFDRYAFPWSQTQSEQRWQRGNSPRAPPHRAGCVLFRRQSQLSADELADEGNTTELLLLLLVGETPTAGVERRALAEALDLVVGWQLAEKPDCNALEVRLLGPGYSGATSSLRLELCDWWRRYRAHTRSVVPADGSQQPVAQALHVRILSGSATAESNRKLLNLRVNSEGLELTFAATVVPDGFAFRQLVDYLCTQRRIQLSQIAILGEGNTSYGSELATAAGAGRRPRTHSDTGIRVLPYPVGLSRVRSEYQRQGIDLDPHVGRGPANTRKNLDLSLEQPRHATDVLPTYSEATTAVIDVTLEHILTSISRDDVRAVGLMGTDVRDKLFLAQFIRRYAPDVQLFTLEADILFTHAQYAKYVRGTIFATSYPLFPRSQWWTAVGDPSDRHEPRTTAVADRSDRHGPRTLQFQTDTAQGVYNAAAVLLRELYPAADGSGGVSMPAVLDYGMPFAYATTPGAPAPMEPVLWLTMLGDSALWPLDAISLAGKPSPESVPPKDKGSAREYVQRIERCPATAPQYRVIGPSLVAVALGGLLGLTIAVPFCIINRVRVPDGLDRSGGILLVRKWMLRAFPWLAITLVPRSAAFSAVLFLSLLALHGVVGMPLVAFVGLIARPTICSCMTASELAFSLLIALIYVTSVFFQVWALCLALRRSRCVTRLMYICPRVKLLPPALVALALCALLAIVLTHLVQLLGSPIRSVVFMERVGAYSSGATPSLPLLALLAAVIFWAACHLRWRYYLRVHPLSAAFRPAVGQGSVLADIDSRGRDLDERVRTFRFWPTENADWLLITVLALGSVYVFGFRWIGTAEGWLLDAVFRLATIVTLALAAVLFIHVKAVCGLFERLLRRLGQHPMASAFSLVPERLAAKAAGQIFAAAPHPGDLEQPVRCLEQLAEFRISWAGGDLVHMWPEGKRVVEPIREHLQGLLASQRVDRHEVRLRAATLTGSLAGVIHEHLAPRLSEYWRSKPVARQESDDKTKAQGAPAGPDVWYEAAETFLAMHYVQVIRQVFAHIQNMLTFLVLMLLCLLFCFDSYPFQPRQLILTLCFGLILWTAYQTCLIMIKFNRDEVLSRLGNTPPNRFSLDRSLVLQLLTYVAIPLASLLLVRFPVVGSIFFQWLDTLQRVFQA